MVTFHLSLLGAEGEGRTGGDGGAGFGRGGGFSSG